MLKIKLKKIYNIFIMNLQIIIFNKEEDNFILCNNCLKIFDNLKKREKNLLFSIKKYDNLNTYILGNNYIIIKIRNIRAIIYQEIVYFFFNNQINIKNIIIDLNKHYENISRNYFVLEIIDLILELLLGEENKILDSYQKRFDSIIGSNLEPIKIIHEIFKIKIETQKGYEGYSDIVELLQYLLDNENDISEILSLIDKGKEIEKKKELENILENGVNSLKDITNEYKSLDCQIHNTKSIMEINMAKFRNDIAMFDININILVLLFSFGSFIVGTFGMNLNNGIEEKFYGTYYVFFPLSTILLFSGIKCYNFYKKIKHNSNIGKTYLELNV